jgi:hypothetical protein
VIISITIINHKEKRTIDLQPEGKNMSKDAEISGYPLLIRRRGFNERN